MKLELEKTFSERIAVLLEQYRSTGQEISLKAVAHVNQGREIGLVLKEWCGAEQVSFSFYQAQSGKGAIPEWLTFERAKQFISISNRLPEPAQTMDDARRVLQLDFVTSGLVQIPERSQPGTASKVAAVVEFVNILLNAKERLQRWNEDEPVDQWPEERIQTVVTELEPFAVFYEELKSKMESADDAD